MPRSRPAARDQAIYRRDAWQCRMPTCLCPDGRDIHPSLYATNSPWAPSIDHIIPKSYGGRWNPANVRAAHRYCNGARGNGWKPPKATHSDES
jgi:5-methylcytosine-specific restriction endonuclease McrA